MLDVLRYFCARMLQKAQGSRLQLYDSYVPIFEQTPFIVTKCTVALSIQKVNYQFNFPEDSSRKEHGTRNKVNPSAKPTCSSAVVTRKKTLFIAKSSKSMSPTVSSPFTRPFHEISLRKSTFRIRCVNKFRICGI